MKNIIALSTSNSSKSINSSVIQYIANNNENVNVIDLRDYDMPIYGIDLENENGIHENAHKLIELLQEADAVVIATPEHNGLVSAFYKNIYDWMSRTRIKYLENTPTALISVSPGGGGAKKALTTLETLIGYTGANVVGTFSLPAYSDNFDYDSKSFKNEELKAELDALVGKLS